MLKYLLIIIIADRKQGNAKTKLWLVGFMLTIHADDSK
jgi:hypothetical protein